MAFPVVESSTLSLQASDTTSHGIALPATINAGDILVVLATFDSNPIVTWDNSTAGTWTLLFNNSYSSVIRLLCYWKVADGTEDGASLAVTTSTAQQSVARAFRISGATSIEAPTVVLTSSGTSADPPNLTPSWGSLETLWIAAAGIDTNSTPTAGPTSYSAVTYDSSNASGSEQVVLAYATRNLSAGSENPSAFTVSASAAKIAATIGVQPAALVPTGSVDATLDDATVAGVGGAAFTAGALASTLDDASVAASAYAGTVTATTAQGPLIITIEATAAIDDAGTLQTFYLSDSRFTTTPADTPASTSFDETIINPGSITLSAFGDGRVGGETKLAFGEMVLANATGLYDDWADYGFDGQQLVIRQGYAGTSYPSDFTDLFTGTIETLTVNETQVIVRLRDRQLIFDRPVLVNTYAGDNALPDGIEGSADDLKGRPKPRLYGGPAREISPVLVNTSREVYQVHDGAVFAIGAVYDQGIPLVAGADYATLEDLLTASVAAGTYATCVSSGLFKLGSAPAGQITCDATQGSGAGQRTAAQLLKALAVEAGVPLDQISSDDIDELDAANPSPLALWIGDQTTYAQAMDQIADTVGAFYAFDASGILRMARLESPSGDPVISLYSDDFINPGPQRKPVRGGDIPPWSYTIRHSRVYTVQTTGLAGSVTADRRAYLANEYRSARAEDAAVLAKHLLATEEVVDSLFTSDAEAQTEAERRMALFGTRADLFDITIPSSVLTSQPAKVGDPAGVTHTRFGMSAGRLFRVLGKRLELRTSTAILTLWGAPTALPTPLHAPDLLGAPVVTGSAIYLSVLTVSDGLWDANPSPTITYQWNRDGSPISGETDNTYTSTLDDAGHAITCTVTASNSKGSASAESNAITVEGFLDADITIFAKAGQSNSLGQDALPMPARTPSDFAIMLDTNKPGTSSGVFGSTFTQAVGQEYIFGGTNHQGDTMCLAIADNLEALIEAYTGQTYAEHGKQVIVVDFGLSSADVSAFGYGSPHFANVLAWCNAVKAAADAIGKTVKFGGIAGWAWGANAYINNIGFSATRAAIDSYCGRTGDIATHVLPIFGQTGEDFPVGILGSHHHYQATDVLTPFVAMAEQDLIASDPDHYSHIDGEGIHHLNGADYGWGGSSTHLHPNEEEEEGGLIAWWILHKVVKPVQTWANMIPMFAKTGARQITGALPDFPDGAYIDFRASGLTPKSAQPMHGWWVCDPSTPTAEIPLVRPPYPGATAGTFILDTTADLPATVEVRYGARDATHLIAGNTAIYFDDPIMVSIKGVSTPLRRSMPALKVQVS